MTGEKILPSADICGRRLQSPLLQRIGSKVFEAFPYYRFSRWLPSCGELDPWIAHFQRLGVSGFIVRHRRTFSLWLYGEEAAGGQRPNTEAIKGKIVAEWRA